MRTKDRGVTLIALVISIIILLILAGVSLNFALGESNMLSQATKANERLGNARIFEELGYFASDYYVASRVGQYEGEIDDYLVERGVIERLGDERKYKINSSKLTNVENFQYGKEEVEGKDVYKMEILNPERSEFEVPYYDKNGDRKVLGKISSTEIIVQVEGLEN